MVSCFWLELLTLPVEQCNVDWYFSDNSPKQAREEKLEKLSCWNTVCDGNIACDENSDSDGYAGLFERWSMKLWETLYFCFHIFKATLCCCCTVLVNVLFFFYVVLLHPFGCISKAPFCWCCSRLGATLCQQKNQASFFRREPKRQNQRNQMSTKERDKNAERQNTFHWQKKQGSLLRERQEYKKTRKNNRGT